MVERWKAFDWRGVEARINAYPNFLTELDGQTIHFVHVRSEVPDARPLLLAHTYPGSVLDFLEMIEPLTDPVAHGGRPEDAFHVVVPSMPGFGFSTPLADGGWTMARVARAYDSLMRGSATTPTAPTAATPAPWSPASSRCSTPRGSSARTCCTCSPSPSGAPGEMDGFGEKEYAALAHLQWFQSVGGYNTMNATRPQTVAAGLADSPVAVLAYSELFESFGNGTSLVRPDQVLAQATLYWLTNTYATAARYHYEEQRSGAEPVVSHGPHRRGRLQGRLPDDPGPRRAGQREHRALVGVPPRWALRRPRGARGRRRRPEGVLRRGLAGFVMSESVAHLVRHRLGHPASQGQVIEPVARIELTADCIGRSKAIEPSATSTYAGPVPSQYHVVSPASGSGLR